MSWTVEYYRNEKDVNVVDDFLKTVQPISVLARFQTVIRVHIEGAGLFLKAKGGAFHQVDDFWQLRADDFRILAKVHPKRKCHLVLLHAFVKKVDRTPPSELALAETAWSNYLKIEAAKDLKK